MILRSFPKNVQLGKDLLVLLCWNSSEVLKNVIEKLTKVVVEVELRYRVVVTSSAM